MELGKGELILVDLPKGHYAIKQWVYKINGLVVGTIDKRILPRGISVVFIVQPKIMITPIYWQTLPKGHQGVILHHYPNLKEARKALRVALIKQIKYITQ